MLFCPEPDDSLSFGKPNAVQNAEVKNFAEYWFGFFFVLFTLCESSVIGEVT